MAQPTASNGAITLNHAANVKIGLHLAPVSSIDYAPGESPAQWIAIRCAEQKRDSRNCEGQTPKRDTHPCFIPPLVLLADANQRNSPREMTVKLTMIPPIRISGLIAVLP